MKEAIVYFPFPLQLCDIEHEAKKKRGEYQEKFKTFSKFQINSRKQIQSKFQI
jgi:hypothetical protein